MISIGVQKGEQGERMSFDDIFYNDINTIIQEAGGYPVARYKASKKKEYTDTKDFLQRLIKLGWRQDYVSSNFHDMHDELIQNWPHKLLTKEIFSKIIRTQYGTINNLKDGLLGIGLRDDVASHLETILDPLWYDSSYTDVQLIDIAVEWLQGDYNPITPVDTKFLIRPDIIDKWVKHEYSPNKRTLIYNIPHQCEQTTVENDVNSALRRLPVQMNDKRYFFHTTNWEGSLSIMKRIDHDKGRWCMDFGIKPGFYLSHYVIDCVGWGIKNRDKWSNEVAIMIFAIPDRIPKHIMKKHLEGQEWIDITKKSRECKQTDELDEIYDYDLVYGNMVSNPKPVKYQSKTPRAHNPPKKQLVGRTLISDKFLQQCLVGCIYFQKFTS